MHAFHLLLMKDNFAHRQSRHHFSYSNRWRFSLLICSLYLFTTLKKFKLIGSASPVVLLKPKNFVALNLHCSKHFKRWTLKITVVAPYMCFILDKTDHTSFEACVLLSLFYRCGKLKFKVILSADILQGMYWNQDKTEVGLRTPKLILITQFSRTSLNL